MVSRKGVFSSWMSLVRAVPRPFPFRAVKIDLSWPFQGPISKVSLLSTSLAMMWAMWRETRETLVCVLPVLVFGEIMGWNGAEAKNEYYVV